MYELYTMGGGTYLVDLLNAVAAITGGGAYVVLAQLAGVAGVGWVLFRTAFGGSWKDNAKWILLFVTVWGAMILPKATVRVVDRLDPALAPAVVANVPVGLALFAALTSQVGDGLTRLTEQAFTLPNDLRYQRHGLIFGSRLAAAATRLEITDTVFARNLRSYARQCVFHALLLGHVSADDLRESTDVWRLVTATGTPSAGASPARMFELATRLPAVGTGATPIDRAIVTCRDGATRLGAQWNTEIGRAGTIFGRRLFPGSRTDALARAELLAALPAAHDFLIGASRSAGEIMRQQMVLNAVHDAGEQWAAEAGNAAALRSYTEAPRRGPDRLCLPGHRAPGRDLGAAAAHRLRVPLYRRLPDGGAAHADPGRDRDLPLLRDGAGVAAILGAALRHPAPHLDGRGGRAHGGRRADARRRCRDLARGPGRGPGGRGRCRGDVGLPLDVGAVPRRGARLRALQRDRSRHLGARGGPGRGVVGRARGHHRQPLAREHEHRHPHASRRSKGARSAPRPMSTPTATPATRRPAPPSP